MSPCHWGMNVHMKSLTKITFQKISKYHWGHRYVNTRQLLSSFMFLPIMRIKRTTLKIAVIRSPYRFAGYGEITWSRSGQWAIKLFEELCHFFYCRRYARVVLSSVSGENFTTYARVLFLSLQDAENPDASLDNRLSWIFTWSYWAVCCRFRTRMNWWTIPAVLGNKLIFSELSLSCTRDKVFMWFGQKSLS